MTTPEQVAAFLGKPGDAALTALATAHLPVVRAFVKAYTRGAGFPDGIAEEDLDAVILTVTARSVRNPEQLKRYQIADYSETPTVLDGFLLHELAVLHQYRRRTQ